MYTRKRRSGHVTGVSDGAVLPALTFEQELLELLARQARRVPIPIFLAAAVIAAMAAERMPVAGPLAWLGLVLLVLVARWVALGRLPRLSSIPVDKRLRIAVVLSAINGITHGLSLTFFPDLPGFERAIQSMLLIALCAGSVSTTGGYMPVFIAYILPTLAPLAILWGVSGTATTSSWVESAAALLFVFLGLILFALARDAFRLFKESFDIRLQQVELNARLREALDEAEAADRAKTKALGEAEVANRAKTRFLAAASHDLRQPIHNVGLFTAALSLRPLDDRSQKIVKDMDKALRLLSSELHSLLDVSKLDAGLIRPEPKAVAIRAIAEELHEEFLAAAEKKDLQLAIVCSLDVHARTDAILLERALRNLLQNAIKYTPAGSVTLQIEADADCIELTVADTGPGIPEDKHELIFEEFYQLDNPERDRTEGLGLGLAIVKRLVDLLQIDMKLISRPGAGTKFVLTLERVYPSQEAPAWHPVEAPLCLEGLNVLVVDDETANRLAMKELLENMGCRVSDAEGSTQAVALAGAERPDLVIVDFRLRGGDNGIAAVSAIRQRYPRMPALIVSGDTAPERLREAVAAGITLLHKPVPAEILKKAIATAVGRLAEGAAHVT